MYHVTSRALGVCACGRVCVSCACVRVCAGFGTRIRPISARYLGTMGQELIHPLSPTRKHVVCACAVRWFRLEVRYIFSFHVLMHTTRTATKIKQTDMQSETNTNGNYWKNFIKVSIDDRA